jgi:hypothetical protein
MPAGHQYRDSDRIGWAHETTHGINSDLRQKFGKNMMEVILDDYVPSITVFKCVDLGQRVNGFYCLENRAAIIVEPNVTIGAVAKLVPKSLRGDVYKLYLVDMARSWDDTPLYICDEWSAYTSGSACRLDLGIKERQETVQYMMEFDIYAIALAMALKGDGYDDQQLKSFIIWNIERSMSIYRGESGAASYLDKFRNSTDAEDLRTFSRKYFGSEWCKKTLGI